jgi:hypothetical protein
MEKQDEKEKKGHRGLTRIRIKPRTPEHDQGAYQTANSKDPPPPPPDLRPGIDTEDSETRDRIYLRLQT